jgi:hypothetical protein
VFFNDANNRLTQITSEMDNAAEDLVDTVSSVDNESGVLLEPSSNLNPDVEQSTRLLSERVAPAGMSRIWLI